ncbi:uncharacterized protein LOC144452927 isoform X2 [Glandiceps talaboti]
MNRQIAYQAKEAGLGVYVTVLDATEEDMVDAEERGINLIIAKQVDSDKNIKWLTVYHKVHYPDLENIPDLGIIIGHAPLTSEAALEIRDQRFPGKEVFLFIHVIPEDIEVHKETWTPERVEEREVNILQAAEKATMVFSVGPRVFNHFDSKFRAIEGKVNHVNYYPYPDQEFFDINIKKPSPEHPVRILTFGRIAGVGNLKGYDIVAGALSKVSDLLHEVRLPAPIWTIRGVQQGQHEESKEYILKYVETNYLKFNLYPYGSQNKIRRDMKQSHMVLMASRSEPFGLVGLEAIAAGIPVLVTSNSGLAQFLKEQFPIDANAMIVDAGVNEKSLQSDIRTWQKAIIDVIRDNYEARFEKAQSLKLELQNSKVLREAKESFITALQW